MTCILTKEQLQLLGLSDADGRGACVDALPPAPVMERLRDLFLLLDFRGRGLVHRDDVLRLLFCRGAAADRLLPWREKASTGPNAVDDDTFAQCGVCAVWTALPPPWLDFGGFLQLCVMCDAAAPSTSWGRADGGVEQHPSACVAFSASPHARLLRATSGVAVQLSDAEMLVMARAFDALDEGRKGFLDVADVQRALGALVKASRTRGRAASCLDGHRCVNAGRTPMHPARQLSWSAGQDANLWGSKGSPSTSRAASEGAAAAETLGDLAEQMIRTALGAAQAQEALLRGLLEEADGRGSSLGAPPDRERQSLLLAKYASLSSRSGSSPRSVYSFASSQSGAGETDAAPAPLCVSLPAFIYSFQARSGAFPPQLLSAGHERPAAVARIDDPAADDDKENAVPSTHRGDRLADLSIPTPSSLSSRRSPPAAAHTPASPAHNAEPASVATPFELTLLVSLLLHYADQLCVVPSDAPSSAGQAAASPPLHTDAEAAQRAGEHAAAVRVHAPAGNSSDCLLRARWCEAAAQGVPLVELDALEGALRRDLGAVFGRLTGVQDMLVDSVLRVARTAALRLYQHVQVIDLRVVVEVATDTANRASEGLGVHVEPLSTRLATCLAMLTSAAMLPRSALARLVELIVELGLHGAPPPQFTRLAVPAHSSNGTAAVEEAARVHDPSASTTAALAALVELYRTLPSVLDGCLPGASATSLEGLARCVVGVAHPVVARLPSSRVGPVAAVAAAPVTTFSYLSLQPLIRALQWHGCVAAAPQVSLPLSAVRAPVCRRVSSQEAAELVRHAKDFVRARGLARTLPLPLRAVPRLELELAQHLRERSPSLCAARSFVAAYTAACTSAVLVRTDGGDDWEARVAASVDALAPSPFAALAGAAGSAEEWAEFAVQRTFCAVGPRGCHAVSLALSRLPLRQWPAAAPASAPFRSLGGRAAVAVPEEQLEATLGSVFASARLDWLGAHERADANTAADLHHAVWDVVGSCPLLPVDETALAGPVAGHEGSARSPLPVLRVVDISHALQHFLEAFPLVAEPEARPEAMSASLCEPTRAPGARSFRLCCRMADVQSVDYALKRLIADGTTRSLASMAARTTAAARAADAGRQPSRGGSAPGAASAGAAPQPIPFDRLRAILEADGLLYILHALGSPGAVAAEMRRLPRVMRALQLSGDCVCVTPSLLGCVPSASASSKGPRLDFLATWRDACRANVGAVVRARAVALAYPANLQHAAVQMLVALRGATARRGDDTQEEEEESNDGPCVDLTALHGELLARLQRSQYGCGERSSELLEAFLSAVASAGGETGDNDTAPQHPRCVPGGVQRILTRQEFLFGVLQARCALTAAAKHGTAGTDHRGAPQAGASSSGGTCSATETARLVDWLARYFSPLPSSAIIE